MDYAVGYCTAPTNHTPTMNTRDTRPTSQRTDVKSGHAFHDPLRCHRNSHSHPHHVRAAGAVLACHLISAYADERAYLPSDQTEACPLIRISIGVDVASSTVRER